MRSPVSRGPHHYPTREQGALLPEALGEVTSTLPKATWLPRGKVRFEPRPAWFWRLGSFSSSQTASAREAICQRLMTPWGRGVAGPGSYYCYWKGGWVQSMCWHTLPHLPGWKEEGEEEIRQQHLKGRRESTRWSAARGKRTSWVGGGRAVWKEGRHWQALPSLHLGLGPKMLRQQWWSRRVSQKYNFFRVLSKSCLVWVTCCLAKLPVSSVPLRVGEEGVTLGKRYLDVLGLGSTFTPSRVMLLPPVLKDQFKKIFF